MSKRTILSPSEAMKRAKGSSLSLTDRKELQLKMEERDNPRTQFHRIEATREQIKAAVKKSYVRLAELNSEYKCWEDLSGVDMEGGLTRTMLVLAILRGESVKDVGWQKWNDPKALVQSVDVMKGKKKGTVKGYQNYEALAIDGSIHVDWERNHTDVVMCVPHQSDDWDAIGKIADDRTYYIWSAQYPAFDKDILNIQGSDDTRDKDKPAYTFYSDQQAHDAIMAWKKLIEGITL